ncbi:MAG TPA: ATP-binding protein, partial [Treponemataceae bacterium]|nr:ATP-binding protein [Treponemataceae bacterium]
VQENLQKIQSSAQYLLSIINDVLDMSRIESGKMTLQKEKFDIKEFIGKVDSIILSQAKAKGLEYTSLISDSVFHSFIGDSLKLQQVLVNILSNAVKFTSKGGSVSLIVEQIFFLNTEQKRKLRFTVSDTGIGIKKKYLPLIFDSFTQQDNSIST